MKILNKDIVKTVCDRCEIPYPTSVVDYDDALVPRWDDNERAVDYFGYDKLSEIVDEAADAGIRCGIAGNGDLYVYK